jgi:indoleamine 2,3-dioxygenase
MAYLQDDPPLPPFDELFPYLETEPSLLAHQIDPFTVTTKHGFLPAKPPLTQLPPTFQAVSKLLDEMPIRKLDGRAGLLAHFKLGPLIDEGSLPDFTAQVQAMLDDKENLDMGIVTALFRDYSFLASAYLLEPCWESWSKDHTAGYGLGRPVLPKCIAGPLVSTAKV